MSCNLLWNRIALQKFYKQVLLMANPRHCAKHSGFIKMEMNPVLRGFLTVRIAIVILLAIVYWVSPVHVPKRILLSLTVPLQNLSVGISFSNHNIHSFQVTFSGNVTATIIQPHQDLWPISTVSILLHWSVSSTLPGLALWFVILIKTLHYLSHCSSWPPSKTLP